jgi:lysophospholipase L1-like esterase
VLIAIGLIIAAIMAGWAVWKRLHPTYQNLPPRAGQVWVAFGDSLTAGTGANEGRDYPALLGQRLGVTIINQGVPGDTTADGLARLDGILKLDPKVVLLCLGGNDGLQRIPLAQTTANLSAIIERLQARGAFVVVIGIRSATLLDQYDGPFKKVARQHHTLFVPNLLKGVLGNRPLMSDQIHPNDDGYAVIAERLAKVLRPHLQQLQAEPPPQAKTGGNDL